jgi:SAM-dependent methyltransferase
MEMEDDPSKPLHEMSPTTRFSGRVSDYVKYRPSYPADAIGAVVDGLGDPASLAAADVGAGTGISSRLLADRGVRVIAVEPNAKMRLAAEAHPQVEWREGTAEATWLADGSVDVVLCAQAFHWVKQPEALVEFARILRPRGRIAIMWNERDVTDPLMTGYRDAIREIGGEHPAEMGPFDPGVIGRSGLYEPVRLVEVANSQRLDEAGLIGRAMSASYVPKEGEKAERLVARLRELWAKHREADGCVTMRYVTRVWVAERKS